MPPPRFSYPPPHESRESLPCLSRSEKCWRKEKATANESFHSLHKHVNGGMYCGNILLIPVHLCHPPCCEDCPSLSAEQKKNKNTPPLAEGNQATCHSRQKSEHCSLLPTCPSSRRLGSARHVPCGRSPDSDPAG